MFDCPETFGAEDELCVVWCVVLWGLGVGVGGERGGFGSHLVVSVGSQSVLTACEK